MQDLQVQNIERAEVGHPQRGMSSTEHLTLFFSGVSTPCLLRITQITFGLLKYLLSLKGLLSLKVKNLASIFPPFTLQIA